MGYHRRARSWPLSATLGIALLLTSELQTKADTPALGRPAADFALRAWTGENVRLSEFLGQVVVLNFWATWAGSSRQEMPVLEKLHATYGSAGLVLLGVSIDEDSGRAADFARALKISYPVLFDTKKSVAPVYGLKAVPTTVLIDRAGIVRYVHAAYTAGSEQEYVKELRSLLDE